MDVTVPHPSPSCTLNPGPGVAKMPLRCMVGAAVCRLVMLPLAGTALVMAAKHAGLLAVGLPPMAVMSECGATVMGKDTLKLCHIETSTPAWQSRDKQLLGIPCSFRPSNASRHRLYG